MDRQELHNVENPAWPVAAQMPLPPATTNGGAPYAAPTIDGDDRLMAGLSHVSMWLNIATGFLGLAVAGGIWLVYRERNQWVAGQALQATFWQIAVLLAVTIASAAIWLGAHLWWTIIGLIFFPLACVAGIGAMAMLFYSLYAALQTFSGRNFRYPLVGVVADPV